MNTTSPAAPAQPTTTERRAARAVARVERIDNLIGDLATGTEFPSQSQFRSRAGGWGAYLSMREKEGLSFWAERHGLSLRTVTRHTKVEGGLEAALRAYVGDATVMPSQAQFRADGMAGLHQTLVRNGGVQAWADKLGLARAGRGRRAAA